MRLVNPLHYPLAILTGGIVLIVGVRFLKLPNLVILPLAGAISTVESALLARRQKNTLKINNPALEREIISLQQQAQLIAQKAEILREEARKILTLSNQIDLLTTVEYSCNQAKELPDKIEQLSHRFHGADSLLSTQELEKQLKEIERKQKNSSTMAQQQLQQLTQGLKRNLELVRQGEDTKLTQIISLSTVIIDAAGVLQQLQNRLHTDNLEDPQQLQELQLLTEDLNSFQENVNLLIS